MDKIYIVYLHCIGFSQKKLFQIFWSWKHVPKHVFENISLPYLEKLGFTLKQAEKVYQLYQELDAKKTERILEQYQVSIYIFSDQEYPDKLRQIANPPYILYVQGSIQHTLPCFSIIGSRNMSPYGKKCIERFIPTLWQEFVIVSWGALGCDTCAHQKSIENGFLTYVVVGTGIDKVYPASNKNLYEKVVEKGGAIISIFPLWEGANGYNFPIRNEIISGMSLWVLVVESAEKSGTLITAKLALEQGREVFSIPWEIGRKNSEWCNFLIYSGEAKIVLNPEHILEEFSLFQKKTGWNNSMELSENQKKICDVLSVQSLSFDELLEQTEISYFDMMIEVSKLEMKKIITKTIQWLYELQ